MKLNVNQAIDKARKLALMKKTDEAEALLRSVLKVAPKNTIAKAQLATLRRTVKLPDEKRAALMRVFQVGNNAVTIAHAKDLQKQYPNTALLYLVEGAAQAQIGNHKNAENAFRRSVSIDPKSAQGFNNLGNSLKEQGEFEPARQAFLTAIKLNAKFAQAYNNLAVLLKEAKKFQAAIRRLSQAIAIDPKYHDAHRNLGVIYQEMGEHKLAISKFEAALLLMPHDLDALSYLAQSQRAQEDFVGAIKSLNVVLERDPKRYEQRQQLALNYSEVSDHQKAIEHMEIVVADRPKDMVALIHLGNAISRTSDMDRAQSVVERVLDIDPNNMGALNNLGVLMQNKGNLKEAGVVFDRALAIDPTVSEIKMNRSVVHFLASEYKQAWPLYDSRFEHENPSTPFLKTKKPLWAGERVRVFVWAEQGIGDEVFFASLLTEARTMVQSLTVSVDKRLKDMFERSFADIKFISRGADYPEGDYDAHIPLAGLGEILRNSNAAFSNQPVSFLKADANRVAQIESSIPAFDGETIGISWNTQNRKSNHVRNIDLAMFMHAFHRPDRRFINLQYGDTDQEVRNVREATGADIVTIDNLDRFTDIEGLSAAMLACDKIITIDNSTVHLAAALGVETHLILAFFPDWRWPFTNYGSPWYPSLNIYRQTSRFGWPGVLSNVDKNL
jgi:tetratricopeptide (TPR) repeat protein